MSLLKMSNISKSFFGVTVLSNVELNVEKGEVHALLGENGAGKSTLMNILGGVYVRDGGTIEFDGQELHHQSIKSAEKAGIAFVHQELNVINNLTVYENLFLNKELVNFLGSIRKKEMIRKTEELFSSLGVNIDPSALVSDLDTSEKQLLEIAKSLFADAKLLILDEPTTALNNDEIDHLFEIIEHLRKKGKTFIFISHKMPEGFRIAQSYTVLRNSFFIKSGKLADTNPEEITRLMVGESYSSNEIYKERSLGEPILELENYSGSGFHDISLSVRRGEVIGFTGLQGSGASDILQTIFGVKPAAGGRLRIFGEEINSSSIHHAMRHRIGMLPANRKENSVIPDMNLLENTYLAEHTLNNRNQIISEKNETAKFEAYQRMLNIKANRCTELITSLSGGNQQKVILARWLNTNAEILLLDNPTQGIDVGAKAEIYKLILELSRSGKTIIVNSLEIPEIQKVADRCIVFYHGTIQTILNRSEITEQNVMLHATQATQASHMSKVEE